MPVSKLYESLVSRRAFLNWAGRSAAFASFLTATRSLPALSADAPTLRVWMGEDYVPAWNAYMPKMMEKVGAELGIKVEGELIPDNDAGHARWRTALESDTLPDVFQGGTSDSAQYYGLGKLHAAARDVFENMKKTNGGWLDTAESFVTAQDGKVYAVPFFTRPWMVHYRADIFDKAGIKVPSATLDDLKAAAKAVNDPKNGLYGVGMPYAEADMDGHMVAMPWLYNSSWQDKNGVMTINKPENLEALKSYLYFHQAGLNPPDALTWGGVGNNNAYLTGLSAIVNNTGSLFAALQKQRPDIAAATKLGPWPKAIANGTPVSTTIGFCLNIAANTKNPDIAAKFVEKMLDVQNMAPLLEAGSGQAMPVRKNLADIEYFKKDPVVKNIVELINPYSRPITYPGFNNPVYGELTSNSSPYFKALLQRVLVDKVSPEDSLKQFAKDAETVAAKYKKG